MSVYIFDTETTDRDPGREIIEACWLKLRPARDLFEGEDDIPPDLYYIESFSRRYKPATRKLSFGAMAVHHILPEELEGCAPSTDFQLPADATYLIGHSIDFDWEAAGAPANVKRIDTLGMAQWIWTETDSFSQSALLYYLQGPTDLTRATLKHAHGAAIDAQNNLRLLRHILARKPELRTWSALWAYSEECRIPRTCPMAKYRGVLLEDLDRGFIWWCLRQDFIDPYYRKGLERVIENDRKAALAPRTESGAVDDNRPF
jgi:exodeoxyribonuclease X